MKKILLIVLISLISASMILAFTITGCKTVTSTTAAAETTAAATTAAETTAATVTETTTDLNQPDPWILDVKKGLDQYRGDIGFKGPQGQTPIWDSELMLTIGEVDKVRQGNYKIIIPWWAKEGEYVTSLGKGIADTAAHLGMQVIAEADAAFDPAKQKNDVETMMALNPDIVIILPLDPTIAAATLRPLVDAGKKVVLISNQPEGFVAGKDYVGITTSMPYDAAKKCIKIIADQYGEDAKVGLVTYAANFWITNFQDQTVRDTIKNEYPKMQVVEEQSFADPNDTTAIISSIIQKNPDVQAFYVTFNTACVGAIAGAKEANSKAGIATIGVSLPLLVDMIQGGNMIGLINDTAYNIGVNCAILAAYGELNKTAPEYTISPNVAFTQKQSMQEIIDTWKMSYNIPLPETITKIFAEKK